MKLAQIMKDKKRKAALFSGLSFIALSASLALPSFSWFAKARTTAQLEGLSGAAHGSYFNGGNGTKDKPYEIDNPKQLYYFNWLQDLGYFNNPNEDKTGINQVYFKLTSDLDMTGVVLPPAGTKTYPFVGNFDGNGKIVSNLTITNDEASLRNAEPPKGAEYSGGVLKQAEIVGFFGVVGSLDDDEKVNNYSYDSSINQVLNMGFDGLDIVSSSSATLVGLAAGYVNGQIKGVGIKGASIATKEDATAITDVVGVKHISEYSLVGYATEEYRSSLDVSDQNISMPQIDNPNTEHGSTNWGGSVNMKQMYTDLKSEIKNSSISKDVTYVTSETVDVSPEGVSGKPYNQVYGNNKFSRSQSSWGSSNTYYYRNGERTDDEENVIASYGLPYQSLNSDQYIYIYGSYTGSSTRYTKTVTKNQYAYTSKISKNGTYLSVDESSKAITATNSAESAASWFVPEAGKSGQVSTNINGTIYYLVYDTSYNLSLATTSGNVTWTYDAEKGNLYVPYSTTTNYYLDYDSSWVLISGTTTSYLTIKDVTANMYVGYSGTSETSPIASSEAAYSTYAWGYSSSNNAYYPVDSTSSYLGISSTSYTQTATVTSRNGKNRRSTYGRFYMANPSSDGTGSGYLLRENFDGTGCTSYLVYSDSKWQVSYNTQSGKTSNLPDQRDQFLISKVDGGSHQSGLTIAKTGDMGLGSTTTSSENATATVNPTYFPLAYSYDDPKTKSSITGVSDMNTGYLVGGANYVNGTDYAGDIRIAEYYKLYQLDTTFGSSSSDSYSSSKMQVLTRSTTKASDGSYSDNGWSKIKDQYNSSSVSSTSISGFTKSVDSSIFSRYDAARKNLQYTIFNSYSNTTASSSTSLYGLHFMNAAISTDHLTNVGKAVVYDTAAEERYEEDLKKYLNKETTEKPTQKGSVYYNYPVPEDSIDFNLATSGFITFFGATYYINSSYGTNDSFFSLQEIVRDEKQNITAIKPISKIYANLGDDQKEKPYLYSYDGSVPSGSDSNHLVFDVSWISTDVQMVTNCLYYFEIPVNPGEYALGSVSGKQGSYLLYLDIGTGAADYESVTIDEKIVSSSYTEGFPKGVDFLADLSSSSNVEGGASASIAILAPRKKELEFAISASGDTTTITSSSSEDLQVVFKNAYAEVKGEDGKAITGVFDTPTIATMERKTVQTFSLTNLTLSMAYSCTWTIENAKAGETMQLYFPGDTVTWSVGSGNATISTDGLVTFSSDGEVTIKAEGTGSKTASEDWEGPTPIIVEDTFSEFEMTISDSSASVEYVYDELSKTYVVTIHCDVEFSVKVISLPTDSDYIILINDQEITATGTYTFKANA